MQAEFQSLKAFSFASAEAYLWVFKKSAAAVKYKAHYVPIDQILKTKLIEFAVAELTRLTEMSAYTYLSQTNENSCLAAAADTTDFSLLKLQVDRPEPEHLISGVKDIKGSEGYVVKFKFNDEIVYAVKRSTSLWKTSYPKKFINMIFSNGELTATEDNTFSIERNFDFFGKGQFIFIANKRAFESALTHREPYIQAFATLQLAPAFSALFTNMDPLITHVGSSSIELRRMATIEQKGLYSQPNFLSKVKLVSASRNWGLNFDLTTSQIIPCETTAKTIMQVLLDHRLVSEVTDISYDVPDTVQI